jgi:tRNA1(Val) A37 N6-methylase TrmN6
MSQRDEMLRQILSDPELMAKYNIKESDLKNIRCNPPYHKKIVEVMATIINDNDNNRSARQIYGTLKNIHKI